MTLNFSLGFRVTKEEILRMYLQMGHSIRVQVELSLVRVMHLRSSAVDLGRVNFGLGRFQINRFLVQYTYDEKNKQLCRKFRSGMVRFGSIRVWFTFG